MHMCVINISTRSTWLPIIPIRSGYDHTHDFHRGASEGFPQLGGTEGVAGLPGNLRVSPRVAEELSRSRDSQDPFQACISAGDNNYR